MVKKRIYSEDEISYEKEMMYWIGYCLQTWSNRENMMGKEIANMLGEVGVKHLLDNYRI